MLTASVIGRISHWALEDRLSVPVCLRLRGCPESQTFRNELGKSWETRMVVTLLGMLGFHPDALCPKLALRQVEFGKEVQRPGQGNISKGPLRAGAMDQ